MYKNLFCCSSDNCNKQTTAAAAAAAATAAAAAAGGKPAQMSCYMQTSTGTALVPFAGKAVCVKYQLKCSRADGSVCSAAAAKAGAWAWMYYAEEGAGADCAKVKAMMAGLGPAVRSLYCCNTPKCNAPSL